MELPVVNKNIHTYLNNHKPWVTASILKSIHHKHHLYTKIIQNKDSKSESQYKTYKNKLTRIIRPAEKMYYANKFNLALGNKKRPVILLKILHWDATMLTANPLLKLKLIITLLLIVISWQINLFIFFSNVGPVLANKIPKKHGDISDYMSGNFSKSMGIIDTNSDEIIRNVKLLKFSFSKGADDISSVVTQKSN